MAVNKEGVCFFAEKVPQVSTQLNVLLVYLVLRSDLDFL
jgi:hypothetical protein